MITTETRKGAEEKHAWKAINAKGETIIIDYVRFDMAWIKDKIYQIYTGPAYTCYIKIDNTKFYVEVEA
jgi:hypothetical protein